MIGLAGHIDISIGIQRQSARPFLRCRTGRPKLRPIWAVLDRDGIIGVLILIDGSRFVAGHNHVAAIVELHGTRDSMITGHWRPKHRPEQSALRAVLRREE